MSDKNKQLSLEDFKGSSIEKAFNSEISSEQTAMNMRETIVGNYKKRLIDKETFEKAITQLDTIQKAEGDRGGNIIGHTKSGKPVYSGKAGGHKDHKNFSPQDHRDAAELHSNSRAEHEKKSMSASSSYGREHARQMVEWHGDTIRSHYHMAEKKEKEQHNSSTPDHEKKIVAEQKKKQADHHEKMRDFHQDIARYIATKHANVGTQERNDAYRYHSQMADHHHSEYVKHSK